MFKLLYILFCLFHHTHNHSAVISTTPPFKIVEVISLYTAPTHTHTHSLFDIYTFFF